MYTLFKTDRLFITAFHSAQLKSGPTLFVINGSLLFARSVVILHITAAPTPVLRVELLEVTLIPAQMVHYPLSSLLPYFFLFFFLKKERVVKEFITNTDNLKKNHPLVPRTHTKNANSSSLVILRIVCMLWHTDPRHSWLAQQTIQWHPAGAQDRIPLS